MSDLISRQMAIDALDEQIEQCNKALGSFDISLKDEYAIKVERVSLEAYKEQLENLPPAQPEITRCKDCKWCDDTDGHGMLCKNLASWVVATDYDFGCVCAERK